MKSKYLLFCLLAVIEMETGYSMGVQDSISLEGTWRFWMDPEEKGIPEEVFDKTLSGTINLPGSMRDNNLGNPITLDTKWTGSIYDSSWYFNPRMAKYRTPDNLKFPFFLTPNKRYVGSAWYQKTIDIPADWNDKEVVLFLERVHWESRVWVDQKEIGMQNSLSAPHVYDLTKELSPGKHILTIRVNNQIKSINPGPDSHSITDQTQGNWNGIVGKIQLNAYPGIWIDRIQTFPDLKNKEVRVKLFLKNKTGKSAAGTFLLEAGSFNSRLKQNIKSLKKTVSIQETQASIIELVYPMGTSFQKWDEFNPALYHLKVELRTPLGNAVQSTNFGMRDFEIKDTYFTINGRKTFLRGTVENCDFPLTGYAPMDMASWMKVFKICKSYGLNEMRFHSYCPPEAAFEAADRAGFYLHVEGPSWANHGSSLGDGKPIDQYIYDETDKINQYYGNHPSFCMLAYGNEPRGGHQVAYLNKFVDYWVNKDSRHVYTGASTGMSWPWVNEEQFIVRSGPRGLPWSKETPGTMFDHRKALEGHPIPYIAHEVGQYCAFPDFKEIGKYTGVYKARNFELFRQDLKDHHMADEAENFLMSSGKLQRSSYKGEIEAALRTPGFAGFELLGLNDYSGQGTALVGVLNVFWQSKGYVKPDVFSQFCGPVVPLIRTPKFVYNDDEHLRAQVEIVNFGQDTLTDAQSVWEVRDRTGKMVSEGSLKRRDVPIGNGFNLGNIDMDLSRFSTATKLRLTVLVEGTPYKNSWDFWVYPKKRITGKDSAAIYYCNQPDSQAMEVLNKGGKVFLLAAGKVEMGKDISMHFLPVFWNTSWFRMRPPHTTGSFIDTRSPAFKYFPTDDFTDFQWWDIVNKQQVMWLKDFPPDFRPIVQPIDTWFLNRRLGLILEAKVGRGKLLISSADLTTDPVNRPAARQLLYSLTKYMESDDFNPVYTLNINQIRSLFKD